MGITGLIPFLEKASKRVNISEFSGCTVAIDSYCWLHRGAFSCADKIVRGEETDAYVKYCLKYVSMLLSKNIKPILVFDGRHLPAKAMTEFKRRESRDISKKRAAELLCLGKIEEARSYMRRSVDITHAMALQLIKECRKRNVDCIVAPYEADAQLAYLNIKKIAHLVITEDSDLILFGCSRVLFKMDLEGFGTLVETIKLPLVMKCPIEHYTFDKFRRMCIMSGCDYLPSLPGIGLAKARQYVTTTQNPDFANALRKLPSYFNKMPLTVTDEYIENFMKAEATFKHQYVYNPLTRQMVRLTEPDDEDIEKALCTNAGELLDSKIAFQLALGNLDPFTLKKMDDWHPDSCIENGPVKTESWKEKGVSNHPTIWSSDFHRYLNDACPWQKKLEKLEPIIAIPTTRVRKKVVNLVSKYVPETQDDDSLSIQSLGNMYCIEPVSKKQKIDNVSEYSESDIDEANVNEQETEISKEKSPILKNKDRSFKKLMENGGKYGWMKKISKFPRTFLDDSIVESKFFSNNIDVASNEEETNSNTVLESEGRSRNPFKIVSPESRTKIDLESSTESLSQKENSSNNSSMKRPKSPLDIIDISESKDETDKLIIDRISSPTKYPSSPTLESRVQRRNPFKPLDQTSLSFDECSDISFVENTYPMETLITPVGSQSSFGGSQPNTKALSALPVLPQSNLNKKCVNGISSNDMRKMPCKVSGLKRTASLPSNQPTLLEKFGFQKKPAIRR